MLCILCMSASEQVIHIFEEQGNNLNVSSIIIKHFWLQPNPKEVNAKVICSTCWDALDAFHRFYERVQVLHKAFLSKSSVPGDGLKEEDQSDLDNLDDFTDFLSADVKLEVKYNDVITLSHGDPSSDGAENVDLLCIDSDSDLEIPLATLAKRSSTVDLSIPPNNSPSKVSEESLVPSSTSYENETRKKKVKAKTPPSTKLIDDVKVKQNPQKKRGSNQKKKKTESEPEDGENRVKRRIIDPMKKREMSKEFDEIIQQNMKLSCNICHMPLANFFLLRKHYQAVHNERGYAICCGRKFAKRGVLVDHIHLHLNPEYFKCERCQRIMADRRSLEVHMITHDTSKQRVYQCKECDKSFFRKLMLDRHMYTHIPERKFTCETCKKLFSSEYTLRQHMNNVHNSAYMKICEHCGKSIRGLETFRRHQLEHEGMPIPLVKCERCGVKLTNKYGLKRHMNSMHPETMVSHICKECGKVSPSAAALLRHMSYMHKCKRIHKCPMCDKAFKKASGLKPRAEDPNARIICCSCWSVLDSFHRLFLMVEEAHAKLSTTNIFNNDKPSESDSTRFAFPELFHTEYDVKPEPNDEVSLGTSESEGDGDDCSPNSPGNESADLSQRTYTKRKSTSSSPPPLQRNIKSEDNCDTKMEIVMEKEKINQPMSESDSEIPLAKLSKQNLPKPKSHKIINQSPVRKDASDSRAKCKDEKKEKVHCRKFDDVIRQNMKLSCTICHKPLSSFFVLKEHYQSVHNETGYVICCEKRFDSRHGLVHHILLHKNPDYFKCDKCGRVLANKKSLKNHMQTHINKVPTHWCEKCKKSFFRKEKFDRHMKTHVRPEQICEQCGKVTRSLRQHQLREHSGIQKQRIQCTKCRASLVDNSSLARHMKYQHPKIEALNVCNICGKISSSGYGLKRHILYMHKTERRHKCPMCEKAFKAPYILRPDENDVNAKVICTSCWCALDTFHKFYLEVEQAHAKLQETIAIDKDELKVESDNGAPHHVDQSGLEPFDEVAADLLNADIKLEVQEDIEVTLLPEIVVAGTEKKEESHKDESSNKRKHSTDSKRSFEREAPPASSTRSRTSAEKSYTECNSSSDDERDNDNTPDWQNQNSDNDDDDDSDYVDNPSKTSKGAESLSATKKRGRPKKGEPRETPRKRKRTYEEQSKKIERIQEYDDLIAKNMKLTCSICLNVSPNFAILKKHYRVIHNECGYATCCGKKFRKRGVLVDHIYTHQNPEYFKCEKCGKVLANRKCLDCHMLTHDTEKQRIYQCDQCTMSFFTRPLLTRHLQTHISVRNIKCPDCDKFFSTQDILRTHINNVHNSAYNRICDQCGKLFRRPDAFRRHQLEHDGITQPLVPCEKCGVKLTSKYGLKRHMESMHPETEVTHVCTTCGKIAPSAAALQRHISYMHKMERKYKCPMCDKAFKKTGGLKENGHDNVTRYKNSEEWPLAREGGRDSENIV